MSNVSRSARAAGVLVLIALGSAKGAVIIDVTALDLQTNQLGTLLPTTALIQIVNLGADGVFTPIKLGDGGSQWVSGDDTLLSLAIGSAEGHTTDRFDVAEGAGDAGFLQRTFDLSTVPSGTKLGIRWFPTIPASAFDPAGTALVDNQTPYGQFTRLGLPLNAEGDPSVISWIIPTQGQGGPQVFRFDPLATASQGGNDANMTGVAAFVIPEPTSMCLLAFGFAGVLARRRR